jgi:biotin-(acetyl-CoA carboxylase) ligase
LLADRRIRLETPDRTVSGHARGVGQDGTLLIESDSGVESYLAGHIIIEPET